MVLNRRNFLSVGTVAALGGLTSSVPAIAQSTAGSLAPNSEADQTFALQAAIDDAAAASGHLFLPAGRYMTATLRLPSGFMLTGVPGATILAHTGSDSLLLGEDASDVTIAGLVIEGSGAGGERWNGGLVHLANVNGAIIRDCTIGDTALNAVSLLNCSGLVENCTVSTSELTGIFVLNAAGVRIAGNTVTTCANGGIRVWREEQGPDRTIVSGNTISQIDWTNGGNGQNGNGINIFRADDVIVANNSIAECAFSAIRLNATNNTHIVGNTCLESGEVAIYSEFAFLGSIIADNIIDGAAGGISITNFNEGGRLATCTGNIVRNLVAGSQTNPDLERPYGIAAEADAVIANNIVDNVAGPGIAAGWGPYLRDVTITGNLIRDVDLGVNVSVAPDAGAAVVTGNTISGARQHAIAGSAWWDLVEGDLPAVAGDYPQLTIGNNTVL